ncbi:MAG: deoxyribose-phosphate aldolase, partial [Clostridiales bacterium]|nr:deoxyribose-phosphate aldolase [Clostridiales bacterium]
MLTPADIAGMLDHSLLQPQLTDEDIEKGCAVAIQYRTASVCARPGDIARVAPLLRGTGVAVSTVIGFPHGSNLTEVKAFEAERALDQGCTELDMVLNIGKLRSGDGDYVLADIRAVVEVAHRRGAIVKVILENCYLTDEQKVEACRLAERA